MIYFFRVQYSGSCLVCEKLYYICIIPTFLMSNIQHGIFRSGFLNILLGNIYSEAQNT